MSKAQEKLPDGLKKAIKDKEVDEAKSDEDDMEEKCDDDDKTYEEVDPTAVSDQVQEIADKLEDALTVTEQGQDTSVEKDANDEQLPDADKETLDAEPKTGDDSKEVAGEAVVSESDDEDDDEDKVEEAIVAEESDDEDEDKVEEAKSDEDDEDKVEEAKSDDDEEDKVEEELKGGQKELDKDNDGDIDAEDLAKLRKEEKDEDEEEDDLEESFKQKAAVVFETAVNEKVLTLRETIEAEYSEKYDADKAELEEKFSEYTDYAVKSWLEENQLEVKYSLRTEVAENFIKGLKGLFEENYIDIPDDEVSVVDELTEAVEGYKDRIDEQTEMLEELHKEVLSYRKNSVVEEVTDGLTETQKIRLEKLSESVEAETTDEFKEKLDALKEAYFDSPEIAAKALSSYGDEVHSMNEGNVALNEDGSPVSQYAKFLSKTVLK
jgi:hypothetical protein